METRELGSAWERFRRLLRSGGILILLSPTLISVAPVAAQTFDRVRETGTLRIGYRTDARPLSFQDGEGNASGYSLAICDRMVKAVKAELGRDDVHVETVVVGTNDRFVAVQQGQIDLLCGAATPTLTRRESVSFSVPIFLGGIGALLRKDAPARLRARLAGNEPQYRVSWRTLFGQFNRRTFGARIGSTAEAWLDERIADFGVETEIVPIGEHADGVDRVVSGQVDVYFGDRAILLEGATTHARAEDLIVVDRFFTYQAIALALARGDEEFRLLVDRVLSDLYRSGEIGEIYSDFFGEPDDTALTLFSRVGLPE